MASPSRWICSGTTRIGLTIRKMHGLSVGCPLPHSLEVFSPSSVRKCNGFNFIFAPDNTQEMPGESGLVSRGSQGLRSPLAQSSLRLTSIESVMPSSHLILCRSLLLLPPIPPGLRVVSSASTGSLASQRHPGKLPKVPGRRRGTRGFPAAPRQRPRAFLFSCALSFSSFLSYL